MSAAQEEVQTSSQAVSESLGKARQLSGVSLSSFIASISTSAALFLIQVVLFLTIKSKFPSIYRVDSPNTTNRFGKIKPFLHSALVRLDERPKHLDRYFFRRYLRTLVFIFAPASIVITPILVPINYIHGKNARNGVSGLDKLGWSNVGLDHTKRYWAHLFLCYLFVLYISWMIWREMEVYVAIRNASPHASSRTVLIDCIPDSWMTEKELEEILQIFPGKVVAIVFNRDFSTLSLCVKRREALARSLETAETRFIQKNIDQTRRVRTTIWRDSMKPPISSFSLSGFLTWWSSEKIDTIAYYRRKMQDLNDVIEKYRSKREDFEKLPSAFVTFDNSVAAHMVCQTVIHTKAGYMTPRMLPISVSDIIWDNISLKWWNRSVRSVASNICIVALAMLCVVPVAFAGLLSQIIYLTKAFRWLNWIDNLPEWALGLIQGVVPPASIACLLKAYSAGLEFLVKQQGISIRSAVSIKMQDYYFYFLFTQLTLLVSLSAGLTAITNELSSGGTLAATLAKNVPKASNYFLSYILLQTLSTSANALLRMDRLIGRVIFAPLVDNTVTEMKEREKGQEMEFGTFVPVYTNLSCIGFLYAIISPIILPFQALIFALFLIIYAKSTILLTDRDDGGLFYPKALKHLLVGVYAMEMTTMALFFLVRDSQNQARCFGQAFLMILIIALTIVYHHLLCKAFDPLLLYTPSSAKRAQVSIQAFSHHSLTSNPIIRLPQDLSGISRAEVEVLRLTLGEVEANDQEATINSSGTINVH